VSVALATPCRGPRHRLSCLLGASVTDALKSQRADNERARWNDHKAERRVYAIRAREARERERRSLVMEFAAREESSWDEAREAFEALFS
jgi:hypothetical protein